MTKVATPRVPCVKAFLIFFLLRVTCEEAIPRQTLIYMSQAVTTVWKGGKGN